MSKSRKASELCTDEQVTVFNPEAKTLGAIDDKVAALQAIRDDASNVLKGQELKKLRDRENELSRRIDELTTRIRGAKEKYQEIGDKLAMDLTAEDREANLAAARVFKKDITEKDLFKLEDGGVTWSYSKHTGIFKVTTQMDIRIKREGIELVVEFGDLADGGDAPKFKEFLAAFNELESLRSYEEQNRRALDETRKANDPAFIESQAGMKVSGEILKEISKDLYEGLANMQLSSHLGDLPDTPMLADSK